MYDFLYVGVGKNPANSFQNVYSHLTLSRYYQELTDFFLVV